MADTTVAPAVEPVAQENQHICVECNLAIQEGQRFTQSPCEHFFHTDCFTQLLIHMNPRHRRCRECNEDIVQLPQGEFDDPDGNYMERREKRHIRQLWDKNREFRNDIKNYVKATRLQRKQAAAVKRIVAQKKTEYNEQWTLLKNQMQALYNDVKASVLATEDYKQYKKSNSKVSRLKREVLDRYHIDSLWMLERALRDKPGLRRIPKPTYHLHPGYIILRGFRFRIRP